VLIDGYSQPSSSSNSAALFDNAVLRIELSGVHLTNGAGLSLSTGGSTVRGLAINHFPGGGISISAGSSNFVIGNFIGTDLSGTLARSNGLYGVGLSSPGNSVGTTLLADRNVISGNGPFSSGVFVASSNNNQIVNNFIGADATGTNALPNSTGIYLFLAGGVVGGAVPFAGNLLSGNGAGVQVNGNGSTIQGNIIGLDANGSNPLPNTNQGMVVFNSFTTIGGTNPLARNIISGNAGPGIEFAGAPSNQVLGNLIGTDITGTQPRPNYYGIYLYSGARGNVIGGLDPSAHNVISGNFYEGVLISQSNTMANTILGNYIGLAADGAAALGNGFAGVYIAGASSNIIGGTNSGARNVICGNSGAGVFISGGATNNLVQGNYIGLDTSGNRAAPNEVDGIDLFASRNQIGGSSPGAGNVISGNGSVGLSVTGNSNVIQGNFIGVDASGTLLRGNLLDGISLFDSQANQIGGNVPGAGNVISDNANGISLDHSLLNVIAGNQIGTVYDGEVQIGNHGAGVLITDSSGNTVGGTLPGAGNTIVHNDGVGVGVATNGSVSVGDAILGNVFYQNTHLSIDLNLDGLNPNDAGDADTGPNTLQNSPVLLSASTAGSTLVSGALNSLPNRSYRLEFFASSTFYSNNISIAEMFLGAANVTTDGAGNANFNTTLPVPAPIGFFVSATATDPSNNTSELSAPAFAGFSCGVGSLGSSQAPAGSMISISGTNFSVAAGQNIVYFGTVRATVVSASPTNLVVVVPPGAAYGLVAVTIDGATSYAATPFVPTFPTAHTVSFAPSFGLPPGGQQSGLAVGDLDGDGRPDLVIAVGQTNSVSGYIYQNIEPGGGLDTNSFAPPQPFGVSGRATAVAVADLDADGLLDIIILTTSPDQLAVFRNVSSPGAMSFQAPLTWPALGGGLGALAVADIDGDGHPDVVATGMTNNKVAIFRNVSSVGAISLAPHVDFAVGTAPVALAVADLDGNGKPDILTANANATSGAFSILRNVGVPGLVDTNSFNAAFSITNGTGAAGIVAADFDGDGKLDIAVSLGASNRVAIYRKTSPQGILNGASFAAPVSLVCPGSPRGLAVADLDGDGKLELIVANTNAASISAFFNSTTPGILTSNGFQPRIDLSAGAFCFAVAAADVDFDGKPDLLAIGNTPDKIALMRNRGNEPFFLINTLPPPGDTMVVTNSATVQIFNRFTNGPIYFTLDGSPPDVTSARYTNSFVLTQSFVLRAIAFLSNTVFFAESQPLTVIVALPPVITLQPTNIIADAGDDVVFSAAAAGPPPLLFQWTKDGVPIPGATNSFLLFTNISVTQAATYGVNVSNPYGSVPSSFATLTVRTAPSILAQPANVSSGVGNSVTFSNGVSGPGPILYQWRRNGVNILGATNNTLTINSILLSDGATYTVLASTPGGTVISTPAQLQLVSISDQAGSDDFAGAPALSGNSGAIGYTNAGATREFGEPLHAGKPGSNSMWYTWTAPAKGIATFSTVGSTFDTLLGIYTGTIVTNLTVVAGDDDSAGYLASKLAFNTVSNNLYYIAVDGFNGQTGRFILSWSFERTNAAIPVITCHPANQSVLKGDPASFTVSATGSNLAYQWSFDGSNIAGATNAFYNVTNAQIAQVGFYKVRVTGAGNRSVESLPAILELSSVPGSPSKEKPEDVYPVCAGSLAVPRSRAHPNAAGAASVAMGSIGYQNVMSLSTNNLADCNTTNCGGIPRGTRYLELTPSASGTLVLDTSGSVPRTRMWVCAKGTNNLDPTRTFLKCDADSAPDGRSLVRVDVQGLRTYQVWSAKIDDANGAVQLNWSLGVPPVLYSVSPSGFVAEGATVFLGAQATNVVAPGVTAPPPGVEWDFNRASLTNGSVLIVSNFATINAGQYFVTASNTIGSTTVVVRVETYVPATNRVVHAGDERIELFANDSMLACPGLPTTYQWSQNGVALTGETNRSLLLRSIRPSQAGAYTVTVTNCFGATTYTNTTLSVSVDVRFIGFVANGQVILLWQTTPGKHYQVQYRASLAVPIWTPLPSAADLTATTTTLSLTDSTSNGPRFYRVVLLD